MKKITLLFALLTCGAFSARAHQDGDSIWNVSTIHDIYLDFSQAGYWDSLTNNYTTDTYMRCDMTFDGRLLPSCGVKFKGNSSYNNPSDKKSFKLDLNNYVSGQDYDGIKKFNLNNGFKDPTFLREKICLDFMRAHGVAAPRCTYARLYINNVYRGFYTLVEEVNSKFLKQHYPDNNGNLFKGDPSGDMRWYGSADSLYYTHYELHSNETANDWSDLVHLVNVVNNTSPSVYFDSLSNVLNAWSFLNYMAACNVFVNLDSYIGSGHNYFTYDDSTDLRFQWIAWDVNEAFGNFNMGMQIPQLQALPYNYLSQPINRPLANKMLA
ncbi:MAG TPA: CotH kinase family protein, partial [Bacteroidia bacterium]|nr:CotH kinase family protein [Bacteroidia bacterium]